MKAQLPEHPIANIGANHPSDHVAESSEAMGLNEPSRDPARDRPNQEYGKEGLIGRRYMHGREMHGQPTCRDRAHILSAAG